jgi:FecR protein
MRFLHFLGAVLVLFASPAMARGSAWIVTQKSGDVRVLRNGLQPASVQLRASLSAGDVIATGATGRAMLTRGDDYVVVAPGSRLLLPKEEQQSGFTRLIQQVGTMLYKVKHTGVPHFAVETPMLAAVVKGTSFTVVVDKDRAAVQVTEGVVEVSSAAGDARRLVEGGVTVYVGREQPGQIIEMKAGAVDLPTSANDSESVKIEGSGDVSLSTVTNLTGGLVREAPVATVVTTSNVPALLTTGVTGGSTPSATPVATSPAVSTPAVAGTTEPTVTQPVVAVVQSITPTATQPVVNVAQTITQPVVQPITQPVVTIVEAVAPVVTAPVVSVVQTVTQPVVAVVTPVVSAVAQPVVGIVETVSVVTAPAFDIVQAVVPAVAQPVIAVVETVVPAVTQPVGGLVGGLLGGGNSGPGGSNSGPGGGGLLGGLLGGSSGSGGNSGPGGGGGGPGPG